MVRTTISGKVVEKSKFRVAANARPRKVRRKGATPARKQDANDRDAVKRLARVLNCNFAHGDLFVTITYSRERMQALQDQIARDGKTADPDTVYAYAKKGRDLFLDRVKYEAKKAGIELKYVKLTSDMDGETGEMVRVHHHLVLPKAVRAIIVKHWSADEMGISPLRDQDDYTPLAEYLIRQVRRQPDRKKYSVSRNMDKPIVKEEIVYSAREIKAPAGARVVYRAKFDAENPGCQYVRYIKPPKKVKRGGHKLGTEADYADF